MNKKYMLAGAILGAAMVGGAFAALRLPNGPGQDGAAHAANSATGWHDPLIYIPEQSATSGERSLPVTGGIVRRDSGPEAPSTGANGATVDAPASDNAGKPEPTGNTDGPAKPGDTGGPADPGTPVDAPQGDPAAKPPVIFNPDVNDALCEVLGCDEPKLPYDPDMTDALCKVLNCDGTAKPGPIDAGIDPCDLIGCPPPKLPLDPDKIILADRRI